jgi:hypothetical protein
MGQLLHGSARTTAAVRRAIQQSQESIAKLARRDDLNPQNRGEVEETVACHGCADGTEAAPLHCTKHRRRSVDCRVSQAYPMSARRLPVCLASDTAAADSIRSPSLPAAARHQPHAG